MEILNLVKHSLYIDGTHEDDYLNYLIEVAKDTIMRGLNNPVEPKAAIFTHAVVLLVSHWYENRASSSESNLSSIPFGVESFMQQLRGAEKNEGK